MLAGSDRSRDSAARCDTEASSSWDLAPIPQVLRHKWDNNGFVVWTNRRIIPPRPRRSPMQVALIGEEETQQDNHHKLMLARALMHGLHLILQARP